MKQVSKQVKMNVGIKKLHKDAVIPSYAHETDCGMDLTAVSKTTDEYGNVVYGFGLAFEIPEGYAGFIFPRSSNYRSGLLLTNCVGIVDSGYRGEVMAKFASRYVIARPQRLVDKIKMLFETKKSFKKTTFYDIYTTMYWDGRVNYNVGDRVAQMVILPYPKVTFVEKEELSETDRGEGGYGSTGK
jgi:dUTP pyrophosphatase